jgi:hypothetical protein
MEITGAQIACWQKMSFDFSVTKAVNGHANALAKAFDARRG